MRPVCCSLCFLPVEEGNGSTLRVQQRCYSWMFVSLLVFNGQSSFEVIAVDACSSLIIIAVSSNLLRYVQSILTFSSPYSPKKTHRQTCTNSNSGMLWQLPLHSYGNSIYNWLYLFDRRDTLQLDLCLESWWWCWSWWRGKGGCVIVSNGDRFLFHQQEKLVWHLSNTVCPYRVLVSCSSYFLSRGEFLLCQKCG